MKPGMMPLTRMPWCAFVIASWWTSALTPALDTLYAVMWPAAAIAAIDETQMIEPLCCSRMIGMTCLQTSHIALRFTSRMRSHASSVRRVGVLSPVPTPTLL
jgi:hypothetical protein